MYIYIYIYIIQKTLEIPGFAALVWSTASGRGRDKRGCPKRHPKPYPDGYHDLKISYLYLFVLLGWLNFILKEWLTIIRG